ncbi:hypothetical protein U1Q18_047436 [Sarracenia purpurea var. burkii]
MSACGFAASYGTMQQTGKYCNTTSVEFRFRHPYDTTSLACDPEDAGNTYNLDRVIESKHRKNSVVSQVHIHISSKLSSAL